MTGLPSAVVQARSPVHTVDHGLVYPSGPWLPQLQR